MLFLCRVVLQIVFANLSFMVATVWFSLTTSCEISQSERTNQMKCQLPGASRFSGSICKIILVCDDTWLFMVFIFQLESMHLKFYSVSLAL